VLTVASDQSKAKEEEGAAAAAGDTASGTAAAGKGGGHTFGQAPVGTLRVATQKKKKKKKKKPVPPVYTLAGAGVSAGTASAAAASARAATASSSLTRLLYSSADPAQLLEWVVADCGCLGKAGAGAGASCSRVQSVSRERFSATVAVRVPALQELVLREKFKEAAGEAEKVRRANLRTAKRSAEQEYEDEATEQELEFDVSAALLPPPPAPPTQAQLKAHQGGSKPGAEAEAEGGSGVVVLVGVQVWSLPGEKQTVNANAKDSVGEVSVLEVFVLDDNQDDDEVSSKGAGNNFLLLDDALSGVWHVLVLQGLASRDQPEARTALTLSSSSSCVTREQVSQVSQEHKSKATTSAAAGLVNLRAPRLPPPAGTLAEATAASGGGGNGSGDHQGGGHREEVLGSADWGSCHFAAYRESCQRVAGALRSTEMAAEVTTMTKAVAAVGVAGRKQEGEESTVRDDAEEDVF